MKRVIARVPSDNRATTFNVVLVEKGDRWGLDDCKEHRENDPFVEFYDSRFPHTQFGQFVQRYNAKTLLGEPGGYGSWDEEHVRGLDLYDGESDWKVHPYAVAVVLAALEGATGQVARYRKISL